MSYLERIIIGAIIVISAFELYNNSEERHQFHEAVRQSKDVSYLVAELAGRCLGCYKCIEQYRQIVVIFVFTAGISLVLDTGIFLGILAQIVISALDFSTCQGQITLPQIQGLLINLAIILFLLKNRSDQKSESKPEPKPVESKPTVAVK